MASYVIAGVTLLYLILSFFPWYSFGERLLRRRRDSAAGRSGQREARRSSCSCWPRCGRCCRPSPTSSWASRGPGSRSAWPRSGFLLTLFAWFDTFNVGFSIWALLGTLDGGGDPGVRRPGAAAGAAQPAGPAGRPGRTPRSGPNQPAPGSAAARGPGPYGQPRRRSRRSSTRPPPPAARRRRPGRRPTARRRGTPPAPPGAPRLRRPARRRTVRAGLPTPDGRLTRRTTTGLTPGASAADVALRGDAPACAVHRFRVARRVRRPSGARACEQWGRGLPARTPARGGGEPDSRAAAAPAGWPLAAAAGRQPSPAGGPRAGASSSSRPWIPTGGLRHRGVARPGRPAVAARPGRRSSTSASGPLVLAPLLLTLGIAWGLSRARPRPGPRLHDLAAGRDAARGAGVWSSACTSLLTLLLALVLDGPDAEVGLLRTVAGAARARASSPSAGGSAGSPACSTPRWTGCPAPPGRCCAACWPACSPRWRCAPPSSRSPLASDAHGYAALSGSLGGAAAGALGLLGLGVLLLPNAAAAVLGLAAGPGLLRRRRHARLGARRDPRRRARAAAAGRAARHPGRAAASPSCRRRCPALAGLVAGAHGRPLVRRRGRRIGGGRADRAASPASCSASSAASLVWVAGGSLGDGGLAQVGAPAAGHGHRGGRPERDRRGRRGHRRPLAGAGLRPWGSRRRDRRRPRL